MMVIMAVHVRIIILWLHSFLTNFSVGTYQCSMHVAYTVVAWPLGQSMHGGLLLMVCLAVESVACSPPPINGIS
jgi:hypothetical protein